MASELQGPRGANERVQWGVVGQDCDGGQVDVESGGGDRRKLKDIGEIVSIRKNEGKAGKRKGLRRMW